jgi:hypothetical protein
MHEVTSNRFAVVLEAADENYSEERASELLAQAGCQDIRPLVEEVEEEGSFL